ncbi:hypothetical protein BRE01_17960 [Brevibacillus reuszeri]|uniref:F5/8 type C domain-containing protein n=1 Tax=Brevibacillus reuszeri TaxID=54915 RepID=A0ABQ0TL13_9BACL|nr:discoidin domain-containing protein [Brevibacillus reuszeri]MED1856217.1 discoidin domain-containing protein [Brevibacillus reuszeri]GED68094.1 hypothetical protein BRE01_17960 [Brevibacillus reuszeri]
MANIGQALNNPEAGWKRIDNTHRAITYTGTWNTESGDWNYGGSAAYSSTAGSKLSFRFYGDKLRIIGGMYTGRTTATTVRIDGILQGTINENNNSTNGVSRALVFEKTGLSREGHLCEITVVGSGMFLFDAIDVDTVSTLATYFPKTVGRLRSSIETMEDGDFIPFRIDVDTVWTYTLNDTSVPEVPLTGLSNTAGQKGFLFLIRVSKGILVADRVGVTGVSWDSLNIGNLIQGKYANTGNLVPVLTSNTNGSVVISASSIYQPTQDAYKAFDRVLQGDTSRWLSKIGFPQWLQVDLGTAKVTTTYTIIASQYLAASPKAWTFEGSNDSTKWDVLDTVRGQIGWDATKRIYRFENRTPYRYYRILITENNGYQGNYGIEITEMELLYEQGVIRSLTGGVGFADANGNLSATNKGLGAWPPNNEWDRYIINFPSQLIQAGKTYTDVFNLDLNVVTWCQDTPSIGMAHPDGGLPNPSTNLARIHRNSIFAWATSNWGSEWNGTKQGFRPVLEYREGE